LRRALTIILFVAWGLAARHACAVTNVFIPIADTSLLEVAPSNNLGGFAGMNAGTTQEYKKTRALMRFNLSSLPTNAVILSAWVQLEVTREPDEPPNNTTFGLHRMLRPWGEGNKSPVSQPGKGLPASPGEATWNCAFHPTNTWTSPGGQPDVDFSSIESSSQFIYGVGDSPYRFDTSPELVADVATWVRNPAANFGWMLLCNDELSNFTARRFSTREDAVNAPPLLEIQYLVPPQIESLQRVGGQFNFSFLARAGQHYTVQVRSSLAGGTWQTLAQVPAFLQDTRILFVDAATTPQRFYRLNTF
jgi:hypothetical protein